MKKILVVLLTILCFIPVTLFAEEKVKVYMFESGGCPYCEAEMEYLKGLEGYKKTFEVIKKELYVDHIDWEQGKDYDLGVKVANAFNEAGYKDASYTGTPFVVISDIYAAAAYSEDLESYIEQAIIEGDNDAVSCIEAGNSNCIRLNTSALASDLSGSGEKAGIVIAILGGLFLVAVIIYIIKNKNNNAGTIENVDYEEDEDDFEEEIIEEEVKKEKPKKQPVKVNKPNKKTNKKTNKRK